MMSLACHSWGLTLMSPKNNQPFAKWGIERKRRERCLRNVKAVYLFQLLANDLDGLPGIAWTRFTGGTLYQCL